MKNTMRKLGLLLAVVIMAVLFATSVSAETWGDYAYSVLDDGTVMITDYTGNATELTIPSQINGRAVTRIGGKRADGGPIESFSYCDSLLNVIIPEGITHIGPSAFSSCDNLKNVTIPKSLIKLGYSVFYGTPFYDTGEWIDNFYIIDGCAVDLDYSKITRDLYIPAEIKIIADNLLNPDVPFFTSFKADEKNEYLSNDEYGVLYNKDKTILVNYPDASKNKEFAIPNTVNTIENLLSWYLESVTIPESVKTIETLVGPSLENVYIYGKSVNIDDESGLCYIRVNYDNWIKCRKEFSELIDTYVLKMARETLTDEESEMYFTKLDELMRFYLSDECKPIGTIHCYPGSTVEAYAKSKGIDYQYITKVKDETTGITAVFAADTFDSEVEMTIVESSTNADIAFKGFFGKYKSYDITFKSNGVEVQPNGKVTVKIPISSYFDAVASEVYHIDENGNATLVESYYKDGYIIFEAEHFSEYAIVDTSVKHEHSYEAVITTPATHLCEGVVTYTCSCDDTYTEIIERTSEHTHKTSVTAPTCTDNGYTTYTCDCGDTYVADYVEAKGHNDSNGDYKCDYDCGYEFEKPTPDTPDIPDEPTEPDTPDEPKEELNFFQKIIQWFKDLFAKLFGWLK